MTIRQTYSYLFFLLCFFNQHIVSKTLTNPLILLNSTTTSQNNQPWTTKVWKNYNNNKGIYFLVSSALCAGLAIAYFKNREGKADTDPKTGFENFLKASSIGFGTLSGAILLHCINFQEMAKVFGNIFAATVANVLAERATNGAVDKIFGPRAPKTVIIKQ